MCSNTPCAARTILPTDHSPFLSDIDGLMGCLLDWAAP
jgi:hypothetical protein